MIIRKTFLSYVKVYQSGLQRVFYRIRITGEGHTVKHEKNEDTSVASFLDYHFDLIENKNTIYPYLILSDGDKAEITDLFTSKYQDLNSLEKNAVKSVIGIMTEGRDTYTYLEMRFTSNSVNDYRIYRTKHPDPAGTLLSTHCGERYELIGVFADGNYGTYEEVIDWYSPECGYDPSEPVPFILDGGKADTVFEWGNAGGGGAVLPPLP